jgi:hypothetical protein
VVHRRSRKGKFSALDGIDHALGVALDDLAHNLAPILQIDNIAQQERRRREDEQ